MEAALKDIDTWIDSRSTNNNYNYQWYFLLSRENTKTNGMLVDDSIATNFQTQSALSPKPIC